MIVPTPLTGYCTPLQLCAKLVRSALWLGMAAIFVLADVRAASEESHIVLIPEYPAVRAGEQFDVAVVLRPQSGWHTYWLNPGESGMAPQFNWQLPDGLTLSKIDYPLPALFTADGMVTIGYDKETALIASFVAASDVRINTTMTITLQLSWLICRDACRAIESSVSLKMEVDAQAGQERQPNPSFAAWRARLPRSGADQWQGHARPHPGGVILRLKPLSDETHCTLLDNASFLPLENGLIGLDAPQLWHQKEDAWEVLLPKGILTAKPGSDFSGLLLLPKQTPAKQPVGWNLEIKLAEMSVTDAHGRDSSMPPQPPDGSSNRGKRNEP